MSPVERIAAEILIVAPALPAEFVAADLAAPLEELDGAYRQRGFSDLFRALALLRTEAKLASRREGSRSLYRVVAA